jgi:pyrimidine operon attenuation protein/uracil phosphoribosyltransferase
MDESAMETTLHRLAQEITAANDDIGQIALMGILSRGRPLADRLAGLIEKSTGIRPPVGSLATTLYRDDLRSGRGHLKFGTGETHFDFAVDDLTVVLVDDVLAAGRTTRAAMDEVMDYGRPKRIQLACLIDRGRRELPIQPDYLGWTVAAEADDYVSVRVQEIDGENVVLLERLEQAESLTPDDSAGE